MSNSRNPHQPVQVDEAPAVLSWQWFVASPARLLFPAVSLMVIVAVISGSFSLGSTANTPATLPQVQAVSTVDPSSQPAAFFPTVNPSTELVPSYSVIKLTQAIEEVPIVIQGFDFSKGTGEISSKRAQFLDALYKTSDKATLTSVGQWFLDGSASNVNIRYTRDDMIRGFKTVFSEGVTPSRIPLVAAAIDGLIYLGDVQEGQILLKKAVDQLRLHDEQAKAKAASVPTAVTEVQPTAIANGSSDGSLPGVPMVAEVDPVKIQMAIAHDTLAFLPPIQKESYGIGGSIIPVLWSLSQVWDIITTGEGNPIIDNDFYVLSTSQDNLAADFGQKMAISQLNYSVVFFGNHPNTEVFLHWDSTKEVQIFGHPRGYWQGKYTENGVEYYWWATVMFWWTGTPAPLRVGDTVHVTSLGPLVVVR